MSLTGSGHNINLNEGNFILTDVTKKIRTPRIEFWDGTNTSFVTYANQTIDISNLSVDTIKFSDGAEISGSSDINLAAITSYGSTTGEQISLTNSGTSLVTSGKVGVANTNPSFDFSVGSDLYVQVSGSNTLTVTNNVAANYFIGDGSLLTGIASTLDDIVTNGNTTSEVVSFTNGVTSVTASGNVVVAKNVEAEYFIGDGSLLTGIASTLDDILTNGSTATSTINLTHEETAIQATSNIIVGNNHVVLANNSANAITTTSNISASHYHGNAKYLTRTTDASAGTFGGSRKAAIVQVSADGRVSSISETDITSNVSAATSGQVAYYTDSTTVGAGSALVVNDGNDALVVGGNLRVSGDLYITGNTVVSNNTVLEDTIFEIGSGAADNTTLGLIMQRPSGNVAMGFVSDELGSAGANTLVMAFTTNGAADPNITPDTSVNLPVRIFGNLTTTSDLIVGAPSQFIVDEANSRVGLSNATPGHDLSIGTTMFVDKSGANTITATNNIAANYFIGDGSLLTGIASTLDDIVKNGNTTSEIVSFTNAATSIIASGKVEASQFIGDGSLLTGISTSTSSGLDDVLVNGATSGHQITLTNAAKGLQTTANIQVGSDLLLANSSANTVVATNNVAASHYHGNAKYLKDTTDATQGSYGTAIHIPQITVDSSGRISAISNVDITESLGSVTARGASTSDQITLTNATKGLETTGNIQVGTKVTLSNVGPNSVVASANISAPYFIGDGSLLTGIAATLDEVATNGSTTDQKLTLTNATEGLKTTSNIQVGSAVLLANAAANSVVVTNNVSASHYHGNAKHLTDTTDAAQGSYGTSVKVPQITVDSNGRISSISNVDLTESLSNVTGRGATTSDQITLTNATKALETTANIQVGSDLLLANASANTVVATNNVAASHYHGNAKYLKDTTDATQGSYGTAIKVPQITVDSNGRISSISNVDLTESLSTVSARGATTSDQLTLTNATKGLETTANIQVGSDLLLANASANTIVATNNVAASHYHGNAKYLVDTTDATQGSYGTSAKVPQITVDSNGRISTISTVDITESLGSVTGRGSTTSDQITLTNATKGLETTANIQVGSDLLLANASANTIVATNNVAASHYHGNAKYLVDTTDATQGSYGTAIKVPQITVDSSGRISTISNVDITESLGSVTARGSTTSDQITLTNATKGLETTGNIQVGTKITLSNVGPNSVVASANIDAPYFIGDGSLLTGIATSTTSNLNDVVVNGSTTNETVVFENATTALTTVSNIQVGTDLLLANASANTIVATNNVAASHYHGNAKYLTNTTDASQGTFGGARKAAIVQVSADGRVSSVNETDIASNVSAATAGQLAYYTDSHTVGGDSKLVFNDGNAALTVGGNLRVSGDLYVTGNTVSVENFTLSDTVFEIGNSAVDNTTLGYIMQRPSGNVAMGFLSDELGSAYTNTLVMAFTTSGAADPNIIPDTSAELPVRIFGNLTTTNDLIVGAPSQFIVDEANSRVGISNATPGHDISVGDALYIDKNGSNTLVTSGSVSASKYHGNAKYLTNTTDATQGSYGTSVKIPQISVGSDGRITSISNVDVAIVESLDSVMARGSSTSTEMSLTNTTKSLQTTGNVHVGTKITLSNVGPNSIVASANISAPYFIGDGSLLTGLAATLDDVAENGSTTDVQLTLTNATKGLETTANIQVGSDLLLANASANTIVATNNVAASHYHGNAKYLVDTTDATQGSYGTAIKVPQITVDSSGRISSISNVDITESLDSVTGRGATTSDQITLTNATKALETTANIQVGSDLLLANAAANTIVATNNVAASHYHGNAKYLTNTTDASQGSYGTAIKIPQITVDSNGRINGINNVDITESLDSVMARGSSTNTAMSLTNSGVSLTTTGDIQVGTSVTISNTSANALVASTNVVASHFKGVGKYLTQVTDASQGSYGVYNKIPQITVSADGRISGIIEVDAVAETLSNVTARGASTGDQVSLTNTGTSLVTSGKVGISNTSPGHDLSVGSNLYVDDTGSNIIVVQGSIACTSLSGNVTVNELTFGGGSAAPIQSLSIQDVAEQGNTYNGTLQLTGPDLSLSATGNVTASHVIVDEFILNSTTRTPTFSSGTLTVDTNGKSITVHHYDMNADISTLTVNNMNNGDTATISITNTDSSSHTFAPGGSIKTNFTTPVTIPTSDTVVASIMKLNGSIFVSASIFS